MFRGWLLGFKIFWVDCKLHFSPNVTKPSKWGIDWTATLGGLENSVSRYSSDYFSQQTRPPWQRSASCQGAGDMPNLCCRNWWAGSSGRADGSRGRGSLLSAIASITVNACVCWYVEPFSSFFLLFFSLPRRWHRLHFTSECLPG